MNRKMNTCLAVTFFNKINRLIKSRLYSNLYRIKPLYNYFERLNSIKRFENIHKGKRCFIIGNGPSLNQLDLKLLKNEITFGVNAIYTNFDKMGFFPTYYFVEDVLVADDRYHEINKYKGSEKFFGHYLTNVLKKDEKSHVLNVVLDYDEKKVDFPRFSTNCSKEIFVGGTVTYLCLQMAYYMGFKEVIMIGFDHNYVIPKDAIINGNRITSTSDDPNHFSPSYFGAGLKWHDPRVDRMEKAFLKAKKYFEADGRNIFNGTAGGRLEVFERKKYENLF